MAGKNGGDTMNIRHVATEFHGNPARNDCSSGPAGRHRNSPEPQRCDGAHRAAPVRKNDPPRELLSEASINYFDLEDPVSVARLEEPMTDLILRRGDRLLGIECKRADAHPGSKRYPLADRVEAVPVDELEHSGRLF
jgi:hypothetical protein